MKTILAIGLFCSVSAFAGTGLEITTLPDDHARGAAVHAVPNSKLVAVGSYGATSHGGLARYLANGVLDIGFGGGDGRVETLVGSWTRLAQFDTAQGKIVAIGEFGFGSCPSPIILRYNDDGSLDTSLGGQGMLFPAIGDCNHASAGYLTDVKIDGNNRIVIAGASSTGHAVIARFSWSGNPDKTFGSQGVFDLTKAAADVGEHASDLVVNSLRLTNGKIIAAGATNRGAMIARISGSGALDLSFGFGGVVVSPPYVNGSSRSTDVWTWARPLSDGSILVVGQTLSPGSHLMCGDDIYYSESKVLIGHYLSNGMLDTSYGGHATGRAAYSLGYPNIHDANGALDSENRLVIGATGGDGGYCDLQTASIYVAARFTPAGILDTTFAGVGYTSFAFNFGGEDAQRAVTVDATDRPLLLGSPDGSGFGLACLTTGGVLDTTFGP